MCWGVLAAVIAETALAQNYKAPEPDLERMAREHRARIEADTAKTLRDAKIGAFLLIAFVVTALYGLAQLAGFV